MVRPSAVQDATASDMVMHRRGCGHVSLKLHVVTSANVYNRSMRYKEHFCMHDTCAL